MSLPLIVESWVWYGVVILVVLFRFTSRILVLGSIKRLQFEDWFMLFVVCMYTVLVEFMNIVANVDSNLILPEDIPGLTPESIDGRVYGSKLVLLVEQCMITTQWGCKVCLLLLYSKLTLGLKQGFAVKIVGAYVIVGWVIMEILYFGVWCQPFSQYWAVPVDNIQCSAAIHHLITNAFFNISSDILMLCIPLPLLITAKLPRLRKAMLCILFGLGLFVILCATLNKYYSFTEPFSPIWTFWYIREASTAVLVANIPNCWPLIRRIFNLRPFSESTDRREGQIWAAPEVSGLSQHALGDVSLRTTQGGRAMRLGSRESVAEGRWKGGEAVDIVAHESIIPLSTLGGDWNDTDGSFKTWEDVEHRASQEHGKPEVLIFGASKAKAMGFEESGNKA